MYVGGDGGTRCCGSVLWASGQQLVPMGVGTLSDPEACYREVSAAPRFTTRIKHLGDDMIIMVEGATVSIEGGNRGRE